MSAASRTNGCALIPVLLAVSLSVLPSQAGICDSLIQDPHKDAQTENTDEAADNTNEAADNTDRVKSKDGNKPEIEQARRPIGPHDPAELLKQLGKLHNLMRENLKLDDEQKSQIRLLFAKHEEETREDTRVDPKERRKQFSKLRKRMGQARKDNDHEEISRIREEIRKLRQQSPESLIETTATLIDNLREHVGENDRGSFDEMVKRLHLEFPKPKQGAGADFRLYLAALRDPELGLPSEKVSEIRKMVHEKLVESRENKSRDKRNQMLESLGDEIMEKLTPDEREIFKAKLDQLRQQQRKQTTAP